MNEAVQGSVIFIGGGIVLAILFFVVKTIVGHIMAHWIFSWASKRKKEKETKDGERKK